MPRLESTRYTLVFATAVCVVCALLVAAAAVGLRERQEANAQLYRQKNVLFAAGLVKPDQQVSDRELLKIFDGNIRIRLVELETGKLVEPGRIDERNYDQRKARNDPALSRGAPPNAAGVSRLPRYGSVYQVIKDKRVEQVVIPVEGVAMWGTVYGFLAIDRDGRTIRGLTFYDQKETPGLGGEIGNPRWQALWHGRKAYDENWEPRIVVIKGRAGPPEKDPYRIDALSGATITSNGVGRLMTFWLSSDGFGKYLRQVAQGADT